MARVLFIACYFPPIGGSGVQRPTKFVKYLPEFGWDPYVIAADAADGEGRDETLLRDIPSSVPVWRVPAPHPQPVRRLQRAVGYAPSPATARVPGEAPALSGRLPHGVKLLRRALVSPLYLVQEPLIDDALYWSLRVARLARGIIERESIDVLLTTSPPWSPLLTGRLLKALTGCPWVADLRDPWTTDVARYHNRGLRRSVDRVVERFCLRSADAVIAVKPDWLQDLRRRTGLPDHDRRFALITNGFDRDDFPQASGCRAQNDIRNICYMGSLYRGAIDPLLSALDRLAPSVRARLHFTLVGYVHPFDLDRLNRSEVRGLFTHRPERMSHPQAVAIMQESAVLLLLLPFDYYPGKIFEYMQAGRPVLAVGREGEASELVSRAGIGSFVAAEDSERLAEMLAAIALDHDRFLAAHYRPRREVIDQYDRVALARRLAEVLDSVKRTGVTNLRQVPYADNGREG